MPTDVPQPDGEPTSGWVVLERERFHELWDRLPALTVLAALPGWGRTSWMAEARAHIRNIDPDRPTRWITTRSGVSDALSGAAPSVGTTCFIDDVVHGNDDRLWDLIFDAAQRVPGIRIVVSTLDAPPGERLHAADAELLDERDLRFDEHELVALVEANGIRIGVDTRDELDIGLRGCPALVRMQLERTKARQADRIWASISFNLDRALITSLLAQLPDASYTDSAFVKMLRDGAAFRRFSAELVVPDDDEHTLREVRAQFERLRAHPLGDIDADDETGSLEFVWSAAAWRWMGELISPADRRAQLSDARERVEQSGRITQQLYYLLELGDLERADALVFDWFRRFLIFTDAVTQNALLALPSAALADRPSLLLLAAELRLRLRGANVQSVRDAESAFHGFTLSGIESPGRRFRRLCRRAMAAALAGDRDASVQQLERLDDALDQVNGSAILRSADQDSHVAGRLAADLFMAFWAAIQTDRHELALRFCELMAAYGDPADITTRIDRLTALTELDFGGLRSMDAAGERPPELEYSHTACIVLLEEGEEGEAVNRSQLLAPRSPSAPTRSAPDGLLLLTQALAAPERLTSARVDGPVALSRSFWADDQASSFISFAAAVAHISLGDLSAARAVTARDAPEDWFSLAAGGVVELAAGSADAALGLFERAGASTGIPRLKILGDVLSIAALVRIGLTDTALARLESTWQARPAPRLLRFALRFVAPSDHAALLSWTDRLEAQLSEVIAASAGDRRPLVLASAPQLTPAEHDILIRLREGRSNAEIAALRDVSSNTIRTQIRLLYRKLNVENRRDAVTLVERAGLLRERD